MIVVLDAFCIHWERPCLKELSAVEHRSWGTEISWLKTPQKALAETEISQFLVLGVFHLALHHFTAAEQLIWCALKNLSALSPFAACFHQSQILTLAKIQFVIKHRSANPLQVWLQLHVNMLFHRRLVEPDGICKRQVDLIQNLAVGKLCPCSERILPWLLSYFTFCLKLCNSPAKRI